MLEITIPDVELFDDDKQEFVNIKGQKLSLEHSLVSLDKWESKWHKRFLTDEPKSREELIDYIRCMTITQNVNPQLYEYVTEENISQINEYINDPMTATTFSDVKSGKNGEAISSELLYYYMIANNVPFECRKWHLNKLLVLLRVCAIKNAPPKKMTRNATLNRYKEINDMRRKKMNTRG